MSAYAAAWIVIERVRLGVFAFLGPSLAWLSFEGLLGTWLAPVALVLAAVGYGVSRSAVLLDKDVAQAVAEESGMVFAFEAFLMGLLALAVVTNVTGASAPGAWSWAAAAAAVVGVAVYVWRLHRAARSERDAKDEARIVRRVELGSLALETALVSVAYTYLEVIRQEGVAMAGDYVLGDMLFVPLLVMVVLGPTYAVLVRVRVAVTDSHLTAEVAMMLSGYYTFMVTPPPSVL